MKTAVTKRGQTTIPAPIRRKYQIDSDTVLQWVDLGESIRVVPIAKDTVEALRGCARNEGLLETLLEERKRDAFKE